MKDSIKKRKKALLALCLSALMLSSTAAFAACSKDASDSSSSSSSAESTEEAKDDGLIKNAGFETFDEDNAINTSVTGWTRSVDSTAAGSASSSKAASGILDLSEEGWKNLTTNNPDYDLSSMTDEQVEAAWDKLTVKDKLDFYELWEENNEDKTASSDLDFYESLNIKLADIPDIERESVKTHDDSNENTKVLMIHNEYPEASSTNTYKAQGTAQKFTSSSTVTVKAGTAAKFSVWVKTLNLESSSTSGDPQPAVGKGAYISVTHSVGGTTLDAYKVENINTEYILDRDGIVDANGDSVDDYNGWRQYSFLLRGSSYTDTTFTLVLGLGQGGGNDRSEYVNGYAFFDDIECEALEDEAYETALAGWSDYDSDDTVGFTDEGDAKIVDAYTDSTRDKFALDFAGGFDPSNDWDGMSMEATTTKINGVDVSSMAGNNPAAALKGGLDGSSDIKKLDTMTNIKPLLDGDALTGSVYEDYFGNDDPFKENETVFLLSKYGVAYTAKKEDAFSVDADGYLAISVFVKTSKMEGSTGAGLVLTSGDDEVAFTSIDTTTLSTVDIGDKEDIYNGWQQYFFFVKNEGDSTANLTLSFHFGPTTIDAEAAASAYYKGFAAFTKLETYATMSEEEFDSVQSGSFAKTLVLGAEEEETGSNFDAAIGAPSNALEKGLANLQNYKGVYSDSAYVTGSDATDTAAINENKNAGLLNKEEFVKDAADGGYYASYDATTAPDWLKKIYDTAATANATDAWNSVFGDDVTQPLFIYNEDKPKAYGFIGNSTSVAANSYAVVSLRVKGTASKAYIRLVDTDSENYDGISAYNKPLTIDGKLTYWYDDDGNICAGDPDEKASRIAFRLQPNGLYKVNKSNDVFFNALKNADLENLYFANLQTYDKTDDEGNLLVADSGASHNYSDYWNNEGMDGIAYYHKDGKYYADRACTVDVRDLSDVTALGLTDIVRANPEAAKKLETTVDLGQDWTTVTFYLHTGDTAKSYRLEIWSGDEALAPNAADTYLIVDYDNPGEAESNFTSLLGDEDYVDGATDKFESVFSYFDTANFLRYNEELDENDVGNLYKENYTPSASAEGIAYLAKKDAKAHTFFADYQYSEKAVTAAAADTDDGEEETEDSEDEEGMNIWLLVSSLAIAIVLLVAVESIIIRKVLAKRRKAKAAQGYVAPKKDKKSKK